MQRARGKLLPAAQRRFALLSVHEVAFFCKAATAGLLFYQSVQLLRTRRLEASLVAACLLSFLCYILCNLGLVGWMMRSGWILGLLSIPIHVGCLGVAFLFWLMSRAIFEDDFSLRPAHALFFAAYVGFSFFVVLRGSHYEVLMQYELLRALRPLFPQGLSAAIMVHALVLAYGGRRADLVEERRALRLRFVGWVGGYVLVVAGAEIALKSREAPAPALLELVHGMAMLATALFLLARWNEPTRLFEPSPVGAASHPVSEEVHQAESEPRVLADEETARALRAQFIEPGRFRDENLTVARLADMLGVREYRLRRHINRDLGFRNFNQFLNHYRIAEARVLLADPSQADRPVLRIAMDLGYGSLAPFNRAFRSLCGQTPSDYRRFAQKAAIDS